MRDFIFIIGASGIGKTTLAKKLYEHYKGAYVEMSMIPEFGVPEGVDEGLFEEQVCWESSVTQVKKFWKLGIRNIVALDFDDLRTRDIPEVDVYKRQIRGCSPSKRHFALQSAYLAKDSKGKNG